jgi:hypothetical protein
MDMAELKAIVQDITKQAGAPKHSDTPRGGDLLIFPSDLAQQQAFLQLTGAANRSLSASLPKSSTGKKGIILNVPLSESEEDLLDSLLLRSATKVERLHRSIDGSTVPTGTVCITFDSPLPSRVTIVALSFTVSTYYPSPYKCSKCSRCSRQYKMLPDRQNVQRRHFSPSYITHTHKNTTRGAHPPENGYSQPPRRAHSTQT